MMDENEPTPPTCGLCDACAAKLDLIGEDTAALRRDLARLMPLADLLDQLAAGDGQAPGVLGMLKMLTGRGGG